MKILKWVSIMITSLVLSVVLVEVFLYIFNPFGLVVRGASIDLQFLENSQSNYRIVENISHKKLDPYVLIRRNSMGFRGKQPPSDYDSHVKIFAVGGSTTACIVLGDGTTWPDRLFEKLRSKNSKIWGTNAGFDGHSTTGHISLLKQHIIDKKPDVVLLLIGINEPNDFYIERMEALNKTVYNTLYSKPAKDQNKKKALVTKLRMNKSEEVEDLGWSYNFLAKINLDYWAKYSQIAATLLNFKKQKIADQLGLTHREVDFTKLPGAKLKETLKGEAFRFYEKEPSYEKHKVREYDKNLFELEMNLISEHVFPQFRKNLKELKELSEKNNFKLVIVTQPAIYGVGEDPDTGANLENMVLSQGNGEWGMGLTGIEKWQLLENINDVSREFAHDNGLLLIDLARQLPKRSAYFYDYIHYSKEGSEKVAEIIEAPLCEFISQEFSNRINLNCKPSIPN